MARETYNPWAFSVAYTSGHERSATRAKTCYDYADAMLAEREKDGDK